MSGDEHSEAVAGGVMRASVGDVLVLPDGGRRTGLVIGVVGKDGAPPYVIKWLSDGHIAMVTPDPYSRIVPAPGGSRADQPPVIGKRAQKRCGLGTFPPEKASGFTRRAGRT